MFKAKSAIGMTLVEFMLALMLSGFIISAIFEIYFVTEKNRLSQRDAISLQENAFILTQLITESLRTTAYSGCAKLTADFPFINHLSTAVSLKNKITPYVSPDVKSGTDAIQLEYFSMRNASLIQAMQGFTHLYATNSVRFKEGDELVISDCRRAETFRVKEIIVRHDGIQQIIAEKPLAILYEKNAALNKIEREVFLVSTSQEKKKHSLLRYSLYRKNNSGEKIELVEGVDAMRVTYTTLEAQQLVEHSLAELQDATAIKSLSFTFELSAGSLRKPWYVYVTLP